MRKSKGTDGAMEVAWSYCIGCNACPVYGLHPIQQEGLDGANFSDFARDFASLYGPGQSKYPVSSGVARVFLESRNQSANVAAAENPFEPTPAPSPFSDPDAAHAAVESPCGRPILGKSAESILYLLADPSKRIEDKAEPLVTSEYWDILSKSFLPTQVIRCIESHLGGAKGVAAAYKASELQRLVAAATYDRESRQLEYEALAKHHEDLKNEIQGIRSFRTEVGAQMPEYPSDTLLHSYALALSTVPCPQQS